MLSPSQKRTLFMELHRAIEESARVTVQSLSSAAGPNISYPPDGKLSVDETAALGKLVGTPDLDSGLRKLIADAAFYPIFHLLCLFDGVADPVQPSEDWRGISISGGREPSNDIMLHDMLYETYWEWDESRSRPPTQ